MTQIEFETMNAVKSAAREYISSNERIDWEQRRYEIAKEMLSVFTTLYFTNKEYRGMVREYVEDVIDDGILFSDEISETIAMDARLSADSLIDDLKKIKK